jgi:hypothetical protein
MKQASIRLAKSSAIGASGLRLPDYLAWKLTPLHAGHKPKRSVKRLLGVCEPRVAAPHDSPKKRTRAAAAMAIPTARAPTRAQRRAGSNCASGPTPPPRSAKPRRREHLRETGARGEPRRGRARRPQHAHARGSGVGHPDGARAYASFPRRT